jgi:hypothetical protein
MNSRYILLLGFCIISTATYAQNGKKKPAVKMAKGSVKKKVVTEAEAKKLHEDQLAKEGKSDVRRAYKRSDFEASPNADVLAQDVQEQVHGEVAIFPKPKAAPVPTVPNTVKAEPKTPRFIETIVLERKEG